jgi:hypothetical protein
MKPQHTHTHTAHRQGISPRMLTQVQLARLPPQSRAPEPTSIHHAAAHVPVGKHLRQHKTEHMQYTTENTQSTSPCRCFARQLALHLVASRAQHAAAQPRCFAYTSPPPYASYSTASLHPAQMSCPIPQLSAALPADAMVHTASCITPQHAELATLTHQLLLMHMTLLQCCCRCNIRCISCM